MDTSNIPPKKKEEIIEEILGGKRIVVPLTQVLNLLQISGEGKKNSLDT